MRSRVNHASFKMRCVMTLRGAAISARLINSASKMSGFEMLPRISET